MLGQVCCVLWATLFSIWPSCKLQSIFCTLLCPSWSKPLSNFNHSTHCQMTAKSVRYHWSDGQGPLWRCLGIPGARLGVETHSMFVLLAETPLPSGICVLLSTSLNSEIWWCGLWTCWCWVQPEVWPFLSPERMEVGPLPPQPPFSLTLPYLQPCFEPFLCAWELKLLRSLFDCCKGWLRNVRYSDLNKIILLASWVLRKCS